MDDEQKAWYDTDENRAYEEAVNSIKAAVLSGVAFDEAAAKIKLKDDDTTKAAVTDAMKVLIAEMHLIAKLPLEQVAEKLRLPLERVRATKDEMMREIEADAIAQYKQSQGLEGNA